MASPRIDYGEQALPPVIQEQILKVNGEHTTRHYRRRRHLGKGGFAHVFEFECVESKALSAAKVIPKAKLTSERTKLRLMNEIKLHRPLHHEHIVQFQHHFEDTENLYILLELCRNQTLNDLLKRRKRLHEVEVKCFTHQIIKALSYLHANNVIHRDLKLGNIFIDEQMQLKLGDFGLAAKVEFPGEKKRTICGTPNYLAPELLTGTVGHSFEVDVWSLGVVTYTLLVGRAPFYDEELQELYRNIRRNSYSYPQDGHLSEMAKQFIDAILVSDPKKRATLSQLLEHPWLTRSPFPTALPLSCLAAAPSNAFLAKFSTRRPAKAQTARVREKSPVSTEKPERLLLTPEQQARSQKTVALMKRSALPALAGAVWVRKWVDYSDKYGVVYGLSDSTVGMHFNDASKIISSATAFKYIPKKGRTECHTFTEYPEWLEKKVSLFRRFQKRFEVSTNTEQVYMKHRVATNHATIFRLSDKTVQAHFHDNSELLMLDSTKEVVFVNKKGEVTQCPMSAVDTYPVLHNRVQYIKDIFTAMVRRTSAKA